MSYTCKYHLRSSVSHHKTPLHSHQIKAVEIIQPVGFYYVYLLQTMACLVSMCLPPKMYAHVPALVAEWAALGEGGGPDVNGHSHLGAGVANNWSGGFLLGKFFRE